MRVWLIIKIRFTLAHLTIIDLFARKLLKHVVPAITGREPSWQQQEEWRKAQAKLKVRVVKTIVKWLKCVTGVNKILKDAENSIDHDEDLDFNQSFPFEQFPEIDGTIQI